MDNFGNDIHKGSIQTSKAMSTYMREKALFHHDYNARRISSSSYRLGFFDQIYAAWINNSEPVWIIGILSTIYQIIIGLRSDANPIIVWMTVVLTSIAVFGRRRYWHISVALSLMAASISAYCGDVNIGLLTMYILASSGICLLDMRKMLIGILALGAGVVLSTLYGYVVFGRKLIIPAISVFVFTSLTAALIRMRANQVREKQQEQAILSELHESESQARVNEKATRMATVLHDSVGHCLTAIISLTEGLQVDDDLDVKQHEIVKLINEYARSGLRQTRTLVNSISGGEQDSNKEHSITDIEELVAGINKLGIRAQLEITPVVPEVGVQIQWTYRIIRESITNTLKHATHATEISVQITITLKGELEVVVIDNGKQMGIHEQTPSTGYGLAHIAADLVSIGGSITAGVYARGGWRVHAIIPKENIYD